MTEDILALKAEVARLREWRFEVLNRLGFGTGCSSNWTEDQWPTPEEVFLLVHREEMKAVDHAIATFGRKPRK